MKLQGCCPPLALPRTQLGGEIIGFDPSTGQFVQAAAGAPPIPVVEYPYYASAGTGMGAVAPKVLWGGLALLVVASFVVFGKEIKEQLS